MKSGADVHAPQTITPEPPTFSIAPPSGIGGLLIISKISQKQFDTKQPKNQRKQPGKYEKRLFSDKYLISCLYLLTLFLSAEQPASLWRLKHVLYRNLPFGEKVAVIKTVLEFKPTMKVWYHFYRTVRRPWMGWVREGGRHNGQKIMAQRGREGEGESRGLQQQKRCVCLCVCYLLN